ncbi:S4 domain-containing protein YaaA [Leuconostoc miyukkimchii]|uniref:S4 domain-containing protein YaaA n=1 Tax=Leuconostoc miyukkimchii TaxID=910540 RepID=UPI001C7CF519|nr:S4 domain-containing protein YaaA [Leuconostoc miyukkimchii]
MTKNIKITTEYITLTQLLKEENIISSGGQAKYYLMDSPVLLNGEPENRRGKKLYNHDEISVAGETYTITLAENADELIAIAQQEKEQRAAAAKKTVRDDRIKAQKAAVAKERKEARFAELRKKNGTRAGGFGRPNQGSRHTGPKGPGSWNSHR